MNPVLLQKQLKENINDLQDFCKDLESWGKEMKRKEESLKNEAPKEPQKKPKRESPKVIKETTDVPKQKMSQIGTTDYGKWDKFDADLECERLESDFKEDSELTDEFEESARDEALVHKDKGNSYVKMKEWDKAIDCYTKAIKCYAYDPIFYANRALCYLKKESFISAEEDCTLSLRLDTTYVKALQRRAAAREALGKLDLAAMDLELVLTHEPKNKESKAAFDRIQIKRGVKEKPAKDEERPVSKFNASRSKSQPSKSLVSNTMLSGKSTVPKVDTSVPSTSWWPDPNCEIIPVKAINKPPHLRSKKPLKRIEITEIDSISSQIAEDPSKPPEAFKKLVVEHFKKVSFEEDVNPCEPVEKTSAFKKNREKFKNEKNEGLRQNAWPKSDSRSDVIKSDDLKVLERKAILEVTPKEVKNIENISITKMNANNLKDSKNPPEETVGDYPIPKTSVQFYSAWKSIKNSKDQYKYLKQLNPQEIPNMFRESLEPKVFSGILQVLSTSFIENGENVYDFLFQLTKVKRFSALAMFMDSSDKNCLWKLIAYLREKNHPNEQVDNLVLNYEL